MVVPMWTSKSKGKERTEKSMCYPRSNSSYMCDCLGAIKNYIHDSTWAVGTLWTLPCECAEVVDRSATDEPSRRTDAWKNYYVLATEMRNPQWNWPWIYVRQVERSAYRWLLHNRLFGPGGARIKAAFEESSWFVAFKKLKLDIEAAPTQIFVSYHNHSTSSFTS